MLNFYTLLFLSIISFNCASSTQSIEKTTTFLDSTIEFASIEDAKMLLGNSDEFTKSLGPFDFTAKTQNAENKSEIDYLQYAAEQALKWSDSDLNESIKVIKSAEEKIKKLGLKLNLPSKITLVLSTCKEEGEAQGYTRGEFIVLNGKPDEHLFLHELWHIISRENPRLRDASYEIIGFKKMEKVAFPDELEKFRITNPDAPFIEHYVPLMIDGEEKNMVITTMASAPYTSGSFFKYLMIILYEVKIDDGKPAFISSPPYNMEQIPSLRDKIGNNTNYIIHPEEITAEHFTQLISESEVKNPDLIIALKELLTK